MSSAFCQVKGVGQQNRWEGECCTGRGGDVPKIGRYMRRHIDIRYVQLSKNIQRDARQQNYLTVPVRCWTYADHGPQGLCAHERNLNDIVQNPSSQHKISKRVVVPRRNVPSAMYEGLPAIAFKPSEPRDYLVVVVFTGGSHLQ